MNSDSPDVDIAAGIYQDTKRQIGKRQETDEQRTGGAGKKSTAFLPVNDRLRAGNGNRHAAERGRWQDRSLGIAE